MNLAEIQRQVDSVNWFHRYEIVPGIFSPGTSDMTRRGDYFPLPVDLRGKRVLDIGASDGYFSFLAEARGAEVVAIDAWPRQGFFLAHKLRDSKVEFRHMSLYDLDPAEIGLFDIVLCFGVYYHLKKPVTAMERIALVTKEFALLESEVVPPKYVDNLDFSVFHELAQYVGDPSNWWVPTVTNFLSTVRAAGFPRVNLVTVYDHQRAIIRADKGPRTACKVRNEDIAIYIDSPQPHQRCPGELEIAGWTVSQLFANQAETRIYAYLDTLDTAQSEVGMADYPLARPDIAPPYGDRYTASGYRLVWTPPPDVCGPHTLHVFVDAPHGWNFRSVPVTIGEGSIISVTPPPPTTGQQLVDALARLEQLERRMAGADKNPFYKALRRVGLLP
jgi:tRNA (mo5U34)-methyltransferase